MKARPILEYDSVPVWLSCALFKKGGVEMITKWKIDRCVTFFWDSI